MKSYDNTNNAKQSLGANLRIKDNARKLRKNTTEAEKLLWAQIRDRKLNGMYFRRQHPYGIYILDFFCFKASLAIEIDGLIHLKHIDDDKERTKYLESTGLKVLRFTNSDVEDRIEWVLEIIRNPHDPFPLGGNKKGGNSDRTENPGKPETSKRLINNIQPQS